MTCRSISEPSPALASMRPSPELADSSWGLHVQGMLSAIRRTGAPGAGLTGDSGISNTDPDLVAYWTFDEGQGFRVADVTKNGHDLILTHNPHWMVGHTSGCCAPVAAPV